MRTSIRLALLTLGARDGGQATVPTLPTEAWIENSAHADDPRNRILARDLAPDDPRTEAARQALPYRSIEIEEAIQIHGPSAGPQHRLRFAADGTARWIGWKNAERAGQWTGRLPLRDFALLCAAAEQAGVERMDARSAVRITHQGRFHHRFEGRSRTWGIEDYGEQAPAALLAFRAPAGEVAARIEWEPAEGDHWADWLERTESR